MATAVDQKPLSAKKERILYIDILKLFTIYLVLWGHSIMSFQPDYSKSIIFQTIHAFHMPLFMMLSGYFATSSMTLKAKEFFPKKIRQLLLPCISWGVVCWLVIRSGLLNGMFHLELKGLFTGWLGLIDNFWFLKSCFICYSLVWFCWRFGRYKLIIIGLVWLLCTMQGRFHLDMMFPSFLTGILLRLKTNVDEWLSKHLYLLLSLFVAMLILSFLTQYEKYYFFRLVLGITGAVSCFELFKLTIGKKHTPTHLFERLAWIGQQTLGVYVLQAIILEFLMPQYISFNEYPITVTIFLMPVLSLLMLIVCLAIIRLIEFSPLFSFIMFGRDFQLSNTHCRVRLP